MPFGFLLKMDTLALTRTALLKTAGIGFRSTLAVSSFRLRARLGFSIPASSFRPARHCPRVRIWRSSFERQRDLNPPDQRAAQRTLRPAPDSPRMGCQAPTGGEGTHRR